MSPALLASRPCRLTSRAFCLICAGVKGWTPEVDAIEDSRRRGTDVVERDATELYMLPRASPTQKLQLGKQRTGSHYELRGRVQMRQNMSYTQRCTAHD